MNLAGLVPAERPAAGALERTRSPPGEVQRAEVEGSKEGCDSFVG